MPDIKPKFKVHVTLVEESLGEVVVRAAGRDAAVACVQDLYTDGVLDTDDFEPNDDSIDVTLVEELPEGDDSPVDYPDDYCEEEEP